MELKPSWSMIRFTSIPLLIVPYGIETQSERADVALVYVLLIVPYGIETPEEYIVLPLLYYLLIVPYGIETS